MGAPDRDLLDEPRDSLVGVTIGERYEVIRRLGRGGMGIVYEARHVLLDKHVAIKVLKSEHGRDENALARFQREARSAASIGDEHIVDVTDFGATPAGEPYIVMELLEGRDLAAFMAQHGALPVGRALGIARQLARALSAAHAKGIIHRDLKSENVFLIEREGKDFVKLLDFGISKMKEAQDPHLTDSGVLLGTPRYMAPEQARGQTDLDQRVDVYALGVILYEMLTGRVPFTGRSSLEIVHKHVHELPEPPRLLRADLPDEIEVVVLRALEKDRDARYETPARLLAALPMPDGFEGAEHAWPLTVEPALIPHESTRISSSGTGRRTRLEVPARPVPSRRPLLAIVLVPLVAVAIWLWPSRPHHDRRPPRVIERVVVRQVVERPAPVDPAAPRVRLVIDTDPREARVLVGGVLQGTGHVVIEAPRSTIPVPVRVEAAGRVAQDLLLPATSDLTRSVHLDRPRREPPPTKAPPTKPPPPPDDLMGNPYRGTGSGVSTHRNNTTSGP